MSRRWHTRRGTLIRERATTGGREGRSKIYTSPRAPASRIITQPTEEAPTTPVDGDPLALVWDVPAEVNGEALELKWDLVAEVTGDSLDLKWDLNSEVTGDALDLKWDTAVEVTGDSLDLKWDLAAETGVVHRAFDGSGSVVSDVGEVNDLTGAFTLAAVIRTSITAITPILTHTNAAIGALLTMSLSATNFLRIAGGGSTRTSTTLSVVPADGWVIFVVTKGAGTVIPRFHLYEAGSWTHEAAPNTVPDIATQSGGYTWVGSSGVLDSTLDVAVAGEWNSALSDGDVETLDYASQNWADLSPLSLWNFDQTVTTDTIPDLAGAVDLNGSSDVPIASDGPAGWVYDVEQPVDGAPLDLVWDTAAEVTGDSLDLKWDLAAEVTGDALDLKWDLAGAVTGDALDLLWDTRSEVTGDALDLIWDTRSEVNGDPLDLLWDTRAQVDGTPLDLLWDTRSEVTGDSLDLLWDLRAEVDGAALDLVWDLLVAATPVNGDPLDLLWDVTAEVNGTALDLVWDTIAQVDGSPLDLVWDSIAQVNGTALALVWDVRTTVDGSPLDLLWDTYAHVDAAILALIWDVRAMVDGAALALIWDVDTQFTMVDGAALRLRWNLYGPAVILPPESFTPGVEVAAYLDRQVRQWNDAVKVNGTEPPAAPVETQTMGEDGATFTLLTSNTDYLFVSSVQKQVRTYRPMKPYREVTEWITVGHRT